jgi:peptide-methionine (R)-S-oxide reductase
MGEAWEGNGKDEGNRKEGCSGSKSGKGYLCASCGSMIFLSKDRATSRTGRPTFKEAVEGGIELVPYSRGGRDLTFIRCRKCGRLIGQLVEEGSGRSAIRICVNCGALDFGQG